MAILVDGDNFFRISYGSVFGKAVPDLKKRAPDFTITEEERKMIRRGFFTHSFQQIIELKQRYSKGYGDLIFVSDSANSWRKSVYPQYKANRKDRSEQDKAMWKDFFPMYNELKDIISERLPYTHVNYTHMNGFSLEADDIIAILSKTQGKHLIVSTDKDMVQLTNENVKIYHPIKRKLNEPISGKKKNEILRKHLVLGDSVDNIPTIKFETSFSDEFIKWAEKEKDLTIDDSFNEVLTEEHHEIIDEYNQMMKRIDEDLVTKGKRRKNLSVYKKERFGDKTADVFLENFEENMEENPLYWKNYRRNELLIDMDNIPEEYVDGFNEIWEMKENENNSFDTFWFFDWTIKEGLRDINSKISRI